MQIVLRFSEISVATHILEKHASAHHLSTLCNHLWLTGGVYDETRSKLVMNARESTVVSQACEDFGWNSLWQVLHPILLCWNNFVASFCDPFCCDFFFTCKFSSSIERIVLVKRNANFSRFIYVHY